MQVFIRLARRHGGQDQQEDVVDQNHTDWQQETPEHWLLVIKALVLVQSCEPAAVRFNEHKIKDDYSFVCSELRVMYPQFLLTVSQGVVFLVSYHQRGRHDGGWNSCKDSGLDSC